MVSIGAFLLILGLYLIGDKRHIFGSTFEVNAYFKNVNGLMRGNNVRLDGVDVGTVKNVEIEGPSNVHVVMTIDEQYQDMIDKNAIAIIGTDGLMGNKLVNITPPVTRGGSIKKGGTLQSSEPLGTEAYRTLSQTNDDVAVIAQNLRIFTEQMNSPNTVWTILTDTTTTANVKEVIENIKLTSEYSMEASSEISTIIEEIHSGKGAIGELLKDTSLVSGLNKAISGFNKTIIGFQNVSDSLLYVSSDLRAISDYILNSKGALNTILADPKFNKNLQEAMKNINDGTAGFEETIEALRYSFLFKRAFKKYEKELEEEEKPDQPMDQ